MRSWQTWFACLGVAGACLVWSGCGGGDVPDPESDENAATESSPAAGGENPPAVAQNKSAAAEGEAEEKEGAAPAVPAAAASKVAEPTEETASADGTEGAAPAAKGETGSATSEMLAMANSSAGSAKEESAEAKSGQGGPGGPGGMPGMMMPPGAGGPGGPGGMPGMMPPGASAPGGAGTMPPGYASMMRPPGNIPGGPPGAQGMPNPAQMGMPGMPGMGGPNGGSGKEPDFRTPFGAVTAFLDAVKAKDPIRLKDATALRAAEDNKGSRNEKLFASILDESITPEDIEELGKTLEGFQIAGNNVPKSTARLGIILQRQGKNGDTLLRTITARKEKAGWKVDEISGQRVLQSGMGGMRRSGRR